MREGVTEILSAYVESLRPIIYIKDFDFKVVDEEIYNINPKAKFVEFNNSLGVVKFEGKTQIHECDLEQFLHYVMDDGFKQETFIILKNIHSFLNDPNIITLLRRISDLNMYQQRYYATIFIISDVLVVPKELQNYITVYDFPLPNSADIERIIKDFETSVGLQIDKNVFAQIALSFQGLNEFQIKQILNLAYHDGGNITEEDKVLILREKEQLIKKSGMLEMINFKESIDDIGGLENLKEWLNDKAIIFKDLAEAKKFGVDMPKGVLIVGMPGCGKSLCAKATASTFDNIPLLRLDIGRLLGKYVGESENNMRAALQLAEAASPCVLWIDELEKAFAGIGGGHEVTVRLFGQFLTWMQEKDNAVFIVATANDISGLPPEFMRKGRFDEIFFVELPNEAERRNILQLHLSKRNKLSDINLDELASATEGYSGGDLEAVVKESIEQAFINGRKALTTADIKSVIKDTKSISDTLGKKLEKLREFVKDADIKQANADESHTPRVHKRAKMAQRDSANLNTAPRGASVSTAAQTTTAYVGLGSVWSRLFNDAF